MSQTWIIATSPAVSHLFSVAQSLGNRLTLVRVGTALDAPAGTSVVDCAIPEGLPIEAMAPTVAASVAAGPGDVILVPDDSSGRVLAGALAARLLAVVLPGARSLGAGVWELDRFGGITRETVTTERPVIILAHGGPAVTAVDSEQREDPRPVESEPVPYNVHIVSESSGHAEDTDLSSARTVVALGRGFRSKADLTLGFELAQTLGASVACSRPLTEGEQWMPKDSYVGISGQRVSPRLYIAVGISGEIQHTAGMKDSGVVVAINTDPSAPIFSQVDYGIVGDLYAVLPTLTQAIRTAKDL